MFATFLRTHLLTSMAYSFQGCEMHDDQWSCSIITILTCFSVSLRANPIRCLLLKGKTSLVFASIAQSFGVSL